VDGVFAWRRYALWEGESYVRFAARALQHSSRGRMSLAPLLVGKGLWRAEGPTNSCPEARGVPRRVGVTSRPYEVATVGCSYGGVRRWDLASWETLSPNGAAGDSIVQ